MILALALSPSVDVTYELPALHRGAVNRPTAVTKVAGGKALNAARVAGVLGAEVRVVLPLGGEPGAWVERTLRAAGIDPVVVRTVAETRTCLALVEDGDATSSTDVYEPASPLSAPEWRLLAVAASDLLAAAEPAWLLVSGSVPRGVPLPEVAELLARARRSGARVALDSSGPALRATVGAADLVKINRAEAAELLGGDHGAAEAASRIHAEWGCDAVVTDGVRGGAAVLTGRALPLEPPAARGRYSAGSGDAFLGALVAALDAGAEAEEALRRARDAAERNALVAGQGVLG